MKKLNKKFYVIGLLMIISLGVIAFSLNKSQTLTNDGTNNEEDIAENTYTDENGYQLAYTINGKRSKNAFPNKDSGLTGKSVTCKNGVVASWDNEKWALVLSNSNGQNQIKCNVNFEAIIMIDYITELASTSSEIVDDETEDHNLRYIGADPNNYVQFNDELWRVIGVMNNVEDEVGTKEPRIKLVRNAKMCNYRWDNKGENGSNDWSDSALMKVLNEGAYYNRTSGTCPNGGNGATTACNFSNNGLTEESKSMISKVKWKLGGLEQFTSRTPSILYTQERGTEVYEGHATEWTGEVGLMYVSDYGYAVGGSDRVSCLGKEISAWDDVSYCQSNDWIGISSYEWMLNPFAYNSEYAMRIDKVGIYSSPASYSGCIRPVIYLDATQAIKGGTGSSTDPYILSA